MTTWNKESITNLILDNPTAVGRALIVLFNNQTSSEQSSEETIVANAKGFTPADGHVGASMAKFYMSRGFLTEKQLAYWRRSNVKGTPRLAKYWKQLIEAIENKKETAA